MNCIFCHNPLNYLACPNCNAIYLFFDNEISDIFLSLTSTIEYQNKYILISPRDSKTVIYNKSIANTAEIVINKLLPIFPHNVHDYFAKLTKLHSFI